MIWVRNCLVRVLSPDADGDRRWAAWLEVENKGATYEKCEINLLLRDGAGAVLGADSAEGDPVPRGVHLLQFGIWPDIKTQPSSGEATLVARRIRGLEPVRIQPMEAGEVTPLSVVPPAPHLADDLAAPAAPAPEPPAAPKLVEPPAAPKLVEPPAPVDPWALVSTGDRDAALRAFEGVELDSAGRERVRRLLRSVAANDLVLACGIAEATLWRSVTTQIRRLVHHGSSDVRAAAAQALGALAGPALVPVLRPLLNDREEAVRLAAEAAIARLGG